MDEGGRDARDPGEVGQTRGREERARLAEGAEGEGWRLRAPKVGEGAGVLEERLGERSWGQELLQVTGKGRGLW